MKRSVSKSMDRDSDFQNDRSSEVLFLLILLVIGIVAFYNTIDLYFLFLASYFKIDYNVVVFIHVIVIFGFFFITGKGDVILKRF